MKIAVPYDNGEIFQHFGRAQTFKMYEAENDNIVRDLAADGQGHGVLSEFVKANGVDMLVCGGMRADAKAAMAAAEITLYGGVSGSAGACIAGRLEHDKNIVYAHCHNGHSDGEHRCGEKDAGNTAEQAITAAA